MSVTDWAQDTSTQAGLYRIVRMQGHQGLYVAPASGGEGRKVLVSARFSVNEVKHWAAQHAQALVMPIVQDADAEIFGVAIDFVLPAQTPSKPHVLCVDEIRFANGAARIFWDADALHIAAENIDTRARYTQRITGGSIKIG